MQVLDQGPKTQKFEIVKNGINSYTLTFQSKFNYASDKQAGQLFTGNETIVTEIYAADSLAKLTAKTSATQVIYRNSGVGSPSILEAVPTDTLVSEPVSFATEKQEGQDSFYVYSDNVATMELPPFDFDLGSISEAFNKSPLGVAPGLSIDGDELTVSISFSGEPLDDGGTSDPSGYEKLKQNITKSKDAYQKRKNTRTARSQAIAASGGSPARVDAAAQAGREAAARAAGGTESTDSNKGEGQFELSGGIAITLKYDKMTGSWEFDNMMFAFGIAGGYDLNVPLAACPIFYFHLSVEASIQLATGFAQVPVGYFNGGMQRKIVYAGFNLSPELYLGIGVGAGISGLAGVELSAYVKMSLSATFARSKVTMGNNIYDIDINNEDVFTVSSAGEDAQWQMKKDENAFKNSIAVTSVPGASITYEVDAYQINVSGSLATNGGNLRIDIWDSSNNVVETKTVSTKNATNISNVTLYSKTFTKRDTYRVKLSLDTNTPKDTVLSLDETNYRTLTDNYEVNTVPAELDEWRFQFGLKVDLYFLLFGYSIDLIYFYVDQDGTGWGYPFNEEQINTFAMPKARSFAVEKPADSFAEIARTTDYLDMTRKNTKLRSALMAKAENRYFDLGDYTKFKSITDVAQNVMPTASSKIYQIGDNTLMLWTVDELDRESLQRQAIYYSLNGQPSQLLDNDGLADVEFTVGTDATGHAVITWCSSRGITNSQNANVLEQYKLLNNSMQIKTAILDPATGKLSAPVVVAGTDDDRQDTLPVFATNGQQNVIAFVKDEKTAYQANVKNDYKASDTDAKQQQTAEDLNLLQNAGQTGVHCSYYTVDNGSGYTKAVEIPCNLSSDVWKAGTKITSNSLAFVDTNTLVYAFTVDMPNAQKGSFSGVEHDLYLQKGIVQKDGSIDFSQGPVLVDKVFDYDESLSVVFPDGDVPDQYLKTDEAGNTGTEENPGIWDAQLKHVVLPDASGDASTDAVTLFYRNKSSLMSISQADLLKVLQPDSQGSFTIHPVMELLTGEYDLNVAADGSMQIVYTGPSDENEYDSVLYIRLYDAATSTWGKQKQLTFNTSFNDAALRDEKEVAGLRSISFKNVSAIVKPDGTVEILTLSTATEFKYCFYTPQGESESVKLAYLDSDTAKRNLCKITLSPADEYEFAGLAPQSDQTLHLAGQTSSFDVTLQNKGEKTLTSGVVEAYFRLSDGTDEKLGSKSFTGVWASEQSQTFSFSYTFPSDMGKKYDLARVHYLLKTTSGKVLMRSLDENNNLTLTLHQSQPEIMIAADKAEVTSTATGDEINYSAVVKNVGFADVTGDATLKLELLEYDKNDQLVASKTVHSQTIPANLMTMQGAKDNAVNLHFTCPMPKDITTTARMQATITGVTNEMETGNNKGSLLLLSPTNEILFGYETQGNVMDAVVGQEITLKDFAVKSKQYSPGDVILEELDTNCLSIDNVTDPAKPKIKIMRTPADSIGYTIVHLVARIRNTAITKTLTINVSRYQIINLDGVAGGTHQIQYSGGSKRVLDCPDNLNGDTLQITENAKILEMTLQGSAIELYGNCNALGGTVAYTVSDDTGVVKTGQITTRLEQRENAGAMLIRIEGLDATKRNKLVLYKQDGELVVLDKIMVDGTVTDLPASAGYTIIQDKSDLLQLPMQSGRSRVAKVGFVFDKQVETAQGADLTAFNLTFTATGIKDSVRTPLADVTFVYDSIDGNTVLFRNDSLVSNPAYDAVEYTLKDSALPNGYLTAKDGSVLNLTVLNECKTTFTLSESKIASVSIVPCKMPGKLDQAIQVTFEKPQMVDRLTGTQILYSYDTAQGQAEAAFVFDQMTDAKTALYTIAAADLAEDEMIRTYTFKEGIVLNNQYALVSNDGQYVDHLLLGTQPTLVQKRAQVTQAAVARSLTDGDRVSVELTFDQPLALDGVGKEDITLTLTQDINGVQTPVTLVYDRPAKNNNTIRLVSKEAFVYNNASQVTFTLAKDAKLKTDVKNESGQTINRQLALSADVSTTFHTAGYVQSGVLCLQNGDFEAAANIPVVRVLFNTTIRQDALDGTKLSVLMTDRRETGEEQTNLTLDFERLQTLYDTDSQPYSLAIFRYKGDPLPFANQYAKEFSLTSTAIEGGTTPILIQNGDVVVSPQLPVQPEDQRISYEVEQAFTVQVTSDNQPYQGAFTAKNVQLTANFTQAISKDASEEESTQVHSQEPKLEYAVGDGAWTALQSGETLTADQTMDTVYRFRMQDAKGFYSKQTLVPVRIDQTVPTLQITGMTNQKVHEMTLLVQATGGISQIILTVNGEQITPGRYTISKNGSYLFAVKNGAGVVVQKQVEVSNLIGEAIPDTGDFAALPQMILMWIGMLLLSGAVWALVVSRRSGKQIKTGR